MDDQKTIERLDDDPVVRRDGGARLAVVRVLLDETLRAGLVDRPRLLKVLDRLRHALPVESRVDLLADPADALGEAERDGEHLAVPAGMIAFGSETGVTYTMPSFPIFSIFHGRPRTMKCNPSRAWIIMNYSPRMPTFRCVVRSMTG